MLSRRRTHILVVVVGTLINVYGQLLVPWLRSLDPWQAFANEVHENPALLSLSVVLGYLFPLFVTTFSAVVTRLEQRPAVSRAAFPDQKPDPVFRATAEGKIVDMGESTRALFMEYEVTAAQDIVGEAVWHKLAATTASTCASDRIFFEAEGAHYLVSHSRHHDETVNVYLTRLCESLALPA